MSMIADAGEVRRALRLFADPENACELRALTSGVHVTLDGSDVDGLADAAGKLPSGIGIYFILNPLNAGLVSAGRNDDVPYRRWVFIDIDPRYAVKGQSATDTEKDGAAAMARDVQSYLGSKGWPAPIVVDSGNGVGLYFRADMPNDELVKSAYARLLGSLAVRFSGSSGVIDRSVHSAAQLVKLPGTWARKGVASDDRPHRPAKILYVPRDLEHLTFDELVGAADDKPEMPGPAMDHLPPAGRPAEAEARRALGVGCARIVLAAKTDEGRNNTLNAVAFEMGRRFVNTGSLTRQEVWNRLYEAACQAGLDTDDNCGPAGIEKTIASGLGSGEELPPEPIPTIKGSTAQTNAETPPDALAWSIVVDGLVIEHGRPEKFLTKTEAGPSKGAREFQLYTLDGLMRTTFPEPRWVIAGILSEGLNILAGKPKMGKSMMSLNLAMTVAGGGMALGNIQTMPGDVLYVSLEDRTRRIQSRARKMLRGLRCDAPGNLTIATSWPRQGDGGLEMIEWWIRRSERPTLCIIDVWGKFRPAGNPKANQYAQDYEHMSPLKDLMDKYGCCGMALMHLRKGASEDVVEDVSGTLGIVGAADGMMILQRARNDNEAKVFITGRDVADTELALQFDPENLVWKNLGPADQHVTGKLQHSILSYLKGLNGSSAFVADIAAAVESETDNVRRVLHRLFAKRLVRHVGNAWAFPGEEDGTGGVTGDSCH